jgi:hypothetical protein
MKGVELHKKNPAARMLMWGQDILLSVARAANYPDSHVHLTRHDRHRLLSHRLIV